MRALLLALVAAGTLAACGDDTTSAAAGDLAVIVLDLSTPGNGAHACGATTCTGACTVCIPLAGGICGIPCNTATPSTCSSGICNSATATDGGPSATLAGDCAAYDGFCG